MKKRLEKVILIHYAEIGLKKGNRKYFEHKLSQNILTALGSLAFESLRIDYGRFVLFMNENSAEEEIVRRLKSVMGIAYFCIAFYGDPEVDILKQQIYQQIKSRDFASFKIETRRADKSYPLTSIQVNQIVGEHLHLRLNKRVDLTNPALTVKIEIYNGQLFYYFDRIEGLRGLPVGSSSRVVSLLSGGIDSPVAAYLMMKRGCRVIFVHFHSFPLTNKASYHNAIKLARKLTTYQYSSKVYLVPLIKLQEAIILNAPIKLRVILYRRMMFRIAEKIANREKAKALITGESVGQVASQTIENIAAISECVSIPVFRPLIGQDKDEIIEKARWLDTFSISTEPFDDCCSYLVPENPETKADLSEVNKAEEQIGNWQELIKQAIQAAEIVKIAYPE